MGKSKVNIYKLPGSVKQDERIYNALKLLELDGMCSSFDKLTDEAARSSGTYYDFLESLVDCELAWKEESRRNRWLQQAHFPWKKALKNFDFSFQPDIKKQQFQELASCRFIDKAENIVLFGPPGVGKTHLAIALGIEAISKGYEVRFFTLGQLIETIEKVANLEAVELRRLYAVVLRPKVLILDEMDLYETNPTVSTFLFKLLHDRYEKSSTIFTSNKTFKDWENIFGSKERAGSIIDRIVHHCTIINIEGESYRLNKLQKKLP